MITIKQKGNFKNIENFFKRNLNSDHRRILEKYGRIGVDALYSATPKDSGETASSWSYQITNNKNSLSLSWHNSNTIDGVSIALLLQYGHASSNGVFIQGRDYINPALKPIFDNIASEIWKEVTRP